VRAEFRRSTRLKRGNNSEEDHNLKVLIYALFEHIGLCQVALGAHHSGRKSKPGPSSFETLLAGYKGGAALLR
jgi:hypothetical protein